eukprot:Hpha_TRINITY_DN8745_c0_g1::TRINITY_DN8745_c0_g1_i1::g.45237::m.45237
MGPSVRERSLNALLVSAEPDRLPKVLALWESKGYRLNPINVSTGLFRAVNVTLPSGVIEYLTKQVQLCPPGSFTATAVANSLFGLRWAPDSQPTRKLLAALGMRLEECEDGLGGEVMSSCLAGLGGTLGNTPEGRGIVAELARRVRGPVQVLPAIGGSAPLRDSAEARMLLSAVSAVLEREKVAESVLPRLTALRS